MGLSVWYSSLLLWCLITTALGVGVSLLPQSNCFLPPPIVNEVQAVLLMLLDISADSLENGSHTVIEYKWRDFTESTATRCIDTEKGP